VTGITRQRHHPVPNTAKCGKVSGRSPYAHVLLFHQHFGVVGQSSPVRPVPRPARQHKPLVTSVLCVHFQLPPDSISQSQNVPESVFSLRSTGQAGADNVSSFARCPDSAFAGLWSGGRVSADRINPCQSRPKVQRNRGVKVRKLRLFAYLAWQAIAPVGVGQSIPVRPVPRPARQHKPLITNVLCIHFHLSPDSISRCQQRT
jgi:hypothetical protein